ncbi:AMP-binding enzyme [Phlyctema vagabunda]|uniref:AMP-binding enzyme n=1 Tax=Phlyctema vagabunda TaxID=108571 RepID=A0ABR4P6N0_9HELO
MSDVKVLIVTGASRGIGLATARFLLQGSNKVVLAARTAAPLQKLKDEFPGQVEYIAADLCDFSVGPSAVALALKSFSRLDGLVINHGTLNPVKRVADSTPEEWRALFDTNFFSALAFITPAIPALRKTHGRIVLTSSGAASNGYSTWGPYGSSKAALNHLAMTLQNEEPDITTIAIRPGTVDTEMQTDIRTKHFDVMDPADATKFRSLYTDGKLLKPDQPGNVIGRLAVAASLDLAGRFLSFRPTRLPALLLRWSQISRTLLTTSHNRGPSEPSLLELTIPEHFQRIVSRHGDRTAVISRGQGKRLSYRELDQQSNSLAHGLQQLGVRKGERVAVSLGNNLEYAITTYALFKLGAILVPLNPAFNSQQVISALTHLTAAHLIIGIETSLPYKASRDNVSLLRQLVPDLESAQSRSEFAPCLANVILVDNSAARIDVSGFKAVTPFYDLVMSMEAGRRIDPDSPLHLEDVVNIQFTSGTTSMPKAASLTHRSILNNGFFIGERLGLTPSDVVCCPPPLFHCFGCILGYMATATHGAAILFPSESFSPEATLRSIQEERATALYGVATMFVAELELLKTGVVTSAGFDNLRTGIAAGSSVPSQLMEKLHKTMNLTGLTICYGMTETSPVSCMTAPDDPLQKRLDSVGKLMPHVEAKVVDFLNPDRILPVGEKGELMVSGYLVMKGYWGDEQRTNEVRVTEQDSDGNEKVWMHTGDEAIMDGEGYVQITGRIKDLIIRGGENIHPLEIENALFAHELIAEASIVGLPDEKYGECVAAFIVVHEGILVGEDSAGTGLQPSTNVVSSPKQLTAEAVREWVRDRLSNHLAPKYVFWVESYPKTASGKIQKFKLRQEGIRLLRTRSRDS